MPSSFFTISLFLLALLSAVAVDARAHSHSHSFGLGHRRGRRAASTNNTVSNSQLETWWHSTGEINAVTAVQPGNVRQSGNYSVQVATANSTSYYDSFVYASIPRNGNGNILIPDDPSSITTNDDGITIEPSIGVSMAWTQFLYSEDVTIKVTRTNTSLTANASDVTIRPETLNYAVTASGNSIYITVPYSSTGARFSVEFGDNLYSYYASCSSPSACGFVETIGDDDYLMAIEPLNALMIFASPFPAADTLPDTTAQTTYIAQPGLVTGLDDIENETLYFGPGVYYFTGTSHANLSSSVKWVHIAQGAYVKGAVEFNTNATDIKATGYGVLSGEQYVYQANPSLGYVNSKSNDDSLKMWSGTSTYGYQQTFHLSGITINAPPFNSMNFDGDLDSFSVSASDYKQVGAYFGQTDGLTIYQGSYVHDVFYHSNDDTIKTYFSNVTVEDITVWKGTTAPVIQFGWASRNMTNVTVNEIDVIHSRWNSNVSHPSIIGGNQVYNYDEDDTTTAVTSNYITNVTYSNIRANGISGNLFRICPLANFENFVIENVTIETYAPSYTGIRESQLPAFTDSDGTSVTISGFIVNNFVTGNSSEVVASTSNKLAVSSSASTDDLNIAAAFLDNGSVTILS